MLANNPRLCTLHCKSYIRHPEFLQYPDSFEKAVLANTNAGGENCHRGAALGGLMGAALGESGIPPALIEVSMPAAQDVHVRWG